MKLEWRLLQQEVASCIKAEFSPATSVRSQRTKRQTLPTSGELTELTSVGIMSVPFP